MSILLLNNSCRIFIRLKKFNLTNDSRFYREFYVHSVLSLKFTEPSFNNVKVLNNSKDSIDSELKKISLVKRKVSEAYTFYEQLSGMDEVRMAQDKVILIQDELKIAQDKRRECLYELSSIRKDLQSVHNDTLNCSRGEPRYLDLVKNEINILQKEKEILEMFQMADVKERELFSYLTSAVKMSHEKERSQANTVKYWSIIGSVLGALLGIIASGLSYRYRNTQIEEIKKQCKETVFQIINLTEKIERLQGEIYDLAHPPTLIIPPEKLIRKESWESFFRRKSVGIYRYFIPRR